MTSRSRLVGLLLSTLLALTACTGEAGPDEAPADPRVRAAAKAFLDRYVDADGRVVRRDQDGDTVSEGVSYALLLAQVTGDVDTERKVWAWAKSHLLRPDGLLSFLAGPDGTVRDAQAASDADLAVAWALGRSADAGLRADAGPLLAAVRAKTVTVRPPGPMLAAGPWAIGEPATLNPSYWILPALRGTDSDQLADRVAPVLDLLSPNGQLPPDWARLDGDRLEASADPGGRFPQPRYGLDAQRTTIWLAIDCDEGNRARAAGHRALLADRPEASARGLDGTVLDPAPHPLPLVAAAAAADADGDPAARDAMLDRAEQQDQRFPTYYGSAWVALGRALLQSDHLDVCQGA